MAMVMVLLLALALTEDWHWYGNGSGSSNVKGNGDGNDSVRNVRYLNVKGSAIRQGAEIPNPEPPPPDYWHAMHLLPNLSSGFLRRRRDLLKQIEAHELCGTEV